MDVVHSEAVHMVRSPAEAIVAMTCRAEGCFEAAWDSETGLCVLHSPRDDKPDFWDALKRQHEVRIRGEVGLPTVDLSRPRDMPVELLKQIHIHIEHTHFPAGFIPEWLFGYPVMISDSSFAGEVSFHKLTLNRELLLVDTVFVGPVDFQECSFGLALKKLHNCTFYGPFVLNNCGIGTLDLHRCTFAAPCIIMDVRIRNKLSATYSHFKDTFSMKGVAPSDPSGRSNVVFFENTRFTHTFFGFGQLGTCVFSACKWDPTGRWPNKYITAPVGHDHSVQEERHRQMRRHFAKEGHTLLANEFALSEMESRRLQLKSGGWRKRPAEFWVLTFHKYLSFYNMRYLRPLFWLLLLLLLLPPPHLLGGFEIHRSNSVTELVAYSIQPGDVASATPVTIMVRVRDWLEALSFAVSSMMIRTGGEYVPASTVSSVARTLGQVLGPALVLVFVFSLRRRLRLPAGLE